MPQDRNHAREQLVLHEPLRGPGQWLPLLGGVLLGFATYPANVAAETQAPDARDGSLRLTREFASLGVARSGAASSKRARQTALQPDLPPTPATPLRLSIALAPQLEPRPPSAIPARRESDKSQEPAAPNAPDPARPKDSPEALPNSRRLGASPAPIQPAASSPASGEASGKASQEPSGVAVTVVGGDDFLPADQIDDIPTSLPARGSSEGVPGAPFQPGQEKKAKRWGMAPVRWGGDVSIGWSQSRSANGDTSSAQVYQGRLRANSYVIQPYIALVSTDFMLTTSRNQSGGDAASNNLSGTSITGSGNLNVFPQSRFPFSAALSLSDSRTDGSFSSSNVSNKRLSLRQQYRPAKGAWNTAVSFDRSQLEGDFGTDVVDRLYGDYSNNISNHAINLSGEFSRNATASSSARTFYAGANHSTQFDDSLSWSNNATILGQSLDADAGDGQSRSARLQSAQLFSFLTWIPQDSRLRANGSLRYFQNRSDIEGSVSEQQTVSGNGGLNFQVSRNLNLGAGAGFNLDKDGNSSTSQFLSAGYSGDPLRFGDFNYNWHSSLSASNSQSSEGDATRSASASAGHGLNRSWMFGQAASLNVNFNQSVGNSRSMGQGSLSSTSLSHGAGLSISANATEKLNGYLSFNLSDNRTTGQNESVFQMLNSQLSGNWRISRLSDLQANLTWQLTRQESTSGEDLIITDEFGQPIIIDSKSENRSSSLGGSISYGHRQFLGVRGLRYQADFRANTGMTRAARRFGDTNADRPEDQVSKQLDQRLLYPIGRLYTELTYSIAEIQGSRHQRIFFRATRSFGGF